MSIKGWTGFISVRGRLACTLVSTLGSCLLVAGALSHTAGAWDMTLVLLVALACLVSLARMWTVVVADHRHRISPPANGISVQPGFLAR